MTAFAPRRLLASAAVLAMAAVPASALDLEFYFPVAVGGDAAGIIQRMVDAYIFFFNDL